ncbi:MAG: hypothetical protein LBH25_05735 [Fibromonadaceae bacterium]|jgi:hypothetical protein|nr:hypothetical protein [Fibromonadaceae bacterium]
MDCLEEASMNCPFCQKDKPVLIDVSSLSLRICPSCKASFLPAEQLPELRRALLNTTKVHWIRVLRNCKESEGEVLCMEHKEPLEKGTVPGFSFESLVPKCCSLQHLTPSVMEKILNLGLGDQSISSHRKKGGIARLLGSPFFRLWEKFHPVIEDEIDCLQYNFKFKDVLGEQEKAQE